VNAVNLVVAFAEQPGGLGELSEQAVDRLPVERQARRRVTRAHTTAVLAAESGPATERQRSAARRARCAR
jgi:hypothetical protein